MLEKTPQFICGQPALTPEQYYTNHSGQVFWLAFILPCRPSHTRRYSGVWQRRLAYSSGGCAGMSGYSRVTGFPFHSPRGSSGEIPKHREGYTNGMGVASSASTLAPVGLEKIFTTKAPSSPRDTKEKPGILSFLVKLGALGVLVVRSCSHSRNSRAVACGLDGK
jgi:hypothetical protein